MKFKIYSSVIALAFSVFGINAQKVNIEKSKVEWIGEKIGGQHNGEIQLKSGEIQFTENLDVDRSEFNVRYGSNSFFDNLGDAAIYDIFKLKIKLITNN